MLDSLRASGYKILSFLYEYPEESFLKDLRVLKDYALRIFKDLNENPFFKKISFSLLENLFLEPKSIAIDELQSEYIRLFEYESICPPYESAYIEDNMIILLLHQLYSEFNLEPKSPYPADFLMFELELMYYLICQKDKLSQKKFLEEHLIKWIPCFSECIKNHSVINFYKDLADLTKEFIKLDFEYLRFSSQFD